MERQEISERGYFEAAKRLYARDGDLEFDEGALVSVSEDGGAYVQCWKWVCDSEVTKHEAALLDPEN